MQYDLVFEGGGAKGIVFGGALQEFFDRGHTIGRLLGTSAGAITATLLAAGYDAASLLAAVNEKLPDGKARFSAFMDVPEKFDRYTINNSLAYMIFDAIDLPLVPQAIEEQIDKRIMDALLKIAPYRQMFSFFERGGLYAGDNFLGWLKEKLNAGGRKLGSATLAGFHKKTGKDISLVASDTIGAEMLVLNHRTAPGVPVIWAVRMSMSIPFVWQEVRWDPSWGKYRGRHIAGHTIVDGGVLSNFPIDLFISPGQEVTDVMGTGQGSGNIIGMLIDENLPVPGSEEGKSAESESDDEKRDINHTWFRTTTRITHLINTMTGARDHLVMETYKNRICRLPAQGYGTTEFDMSDQRVQALVMAGQAAMKAYFDG
ncbi:MAG: patatin-like phospholipase family protein [Anaerolineales bacterium]